MRVSPLRDGKFLQKLGLSVNARFWLKVEGDDYSECWLWLGSTLNGYGQFGTEGNATVRAHRFAYESIVGPIPEGLHLDHLCRNRSCVNPWHLEPVSQAVNNQRSGSAKKRCPQGHEFTPENTKHRAQGRLCRECGRAHTRAYKARLRAANKGSAAA